MACVVLTKLLSGLFTHLISHWPNRCFKFDTAENCKICRLFADSWHPTTCYSADGSLSWCKINGLIRATLTLSCFVVPQSQKVFIKVCRFGILRTTRKHNFRTTMTWSVSHRSIYTTLLCPARSRYSSQFSCSKVPFYSQYSSPAINNNSRYQHYGPPLLAPNLNICPVLPSHSNQPLIQILHPNHNTTIQTRIHLHFTASQGLRGSAVYYGVSPVYDIFHGHRSAEMLWLDGDLEAGSW